MNTEVESEASLYRRLQEHMDQHPAGFPALESGSDIRLLKVLYTPEQARVCLLLAVTPEPISTIHQRAVDSGMSISRDELENILNDIFHSGNLMTYYEGYDETHYAMLMPVPGGLESHQINHLHTREYYEAVKDFYPERTKAYGLPTEVNGLRVVPVEKSVPHADRFAVTSYEDVRQIVESAPGPFSVANCICRQRRERFEESPCKRTELRETCIQIGPDQARRYVDIGIGRFVTRDEVFDLLERAQQDGLVLQAENSRRPDNICLCCGDCCYELFPFKEHPRPVEWFFTNHYATVDPHACKGCGTCIIKCQLDARTVVDGIAVIDLDRCVGCGNCAALCPNGANKLREKSQPMVPEIDKNAYLMKVKRARTAKEVAV